MSETQKILGQSMPAAGVLTDTYAAGAKAVVSSFVACNQSASATKMRLSVAQAGAADAPNQYLYYDLDLPGNDTFIATIGATLGATDVVRCYSLSGSVSFNLFGVEVS